MQPALRPLDNQRIFLKNLFAKAVEAADPAHCLPSQLPTPPSSRTIVVGAGKAAASMAKAVEDNWPGQIEGLVVTRYDHAVKCAKIEVVEAAHPVPDEKGIDAAKRILQMVKGLTENDLVLCLISGGGSALLSMPAAGITLKEKQSINRQLLKSGAPIDAMNTVRKHLSAIKGGRLASAAYPARVVTLAISDVPGDDPAIIASGPTIFDTTTPIDALAILQKYNIDLPESIAQHLTNNEFVPATNQSHPDNQYKIIATPQSSLEAAARYCLECGVRPLILGDAIEGEAREVAATMANFTQEFSANQLSGNWPVAILSGGETTVTVQGNGRGGRNAEYLLALGLALDHSPNIHSIACDTDGIDGSEDNAGAYWGPDTLRRAKSLGIDPSAMLDNNDGYGFFSKLGDLIITGPTRTNVNDFRATLVYFSHG
jgi:glycerate 2-kinase